MHLESMNQATLFVCDLCRFSTVEKSRDGLSGGQYLIHQLQVELEAHNLQDDIQLQPVRCMAACNQSCNVTLAAPDKLTFIFSRLSPTESAAALLTFGQQYAACPRGKVPYRARSAMIREATAYVLPPLPATSSPTR